MNLGGVDAPNRHRSGGGILNDARFLSGQLSNNECQVPG